MPRKALLLVATDQSIYKIRKLSTANCYADLWNGREVDSLSWPWLLQLSRQHRDFKSRDQPQVLRLWDEEDKTDRSRRIITTTAFCAMISSLSHSTNPHYIRENNIRLAVFGIAGYHGKGITEK